MKGARSEGRCTLVGAGPGDPQLLTLAALRAIRRASVLLVDDLVPEALLDFALRGVRRPPRIVHVGKRGGCASTPQAFIEKLMIAEARRGENVVRLKGGDPFLFGRGGEEVQRLQDAGIEVRVVHGITAGVAAAGALGAALTHRDHAQGVLFVTGHARADDTSGTLPDWATLGSVAAQGITLVIYMGVTQIEAITAGLLHALPATTPAAVVQHASLPEQRELVTTLGELATALRCAGLGSPAVIVIGDVLHARAQLKQAPNDIAEQDTLIHQRG